MAMSRLLLMVLLVVSSTWSYLIPLPSSKPSTVVFTLRAAGNAAGKSSIIPSLIKEYSTFFQYFATENYAANVRFKDPLTSFEGISKYRANVDMLGSRTLLGKLLFEDASIVLHTIDQVDDKTIQTRWTLSVTMKGLPWIPRLKFSGISIYTLNDALLIQNQVDYWDSINLNKGKYEEVSFMDGVNDFLSQVFVESTAEMAAPELPYELLRRGKRYEIRRYPATIVAETTYEQRPEVSIYSLTLLFAHLFFHLLKGYDRLGSYAGGSNVNNKRLEFFSPTIMLISDTDGARQKLMQWPLAFTFPGKLSQIVSSFPEPTISNVVIKEEVGKIVGVTRFDVRATEPVVRGYTKQLISDLTNDGLSVKDDNRIDNYIIGQYDALFSLNKRRNEVWVELEKSSSWLDNLSS